MKRLNRRTLLASAAAAASGLGVAASAQPVTSPAPQTTPRSDGLMDPPAPGYYPYSGLSGPGFPATAQSETGGWRSGSAGVSYKGAHPPSWKTLEWKPEYDSGSAVAKGLLPRIRPLLEVHVRDTVVCLAGDGNYYMTGSTGDNIWAVADGVELWRSPDLKTWSYMGLVWSIEKEGTWEKQWRGLHGKPARALWAPEIHFVKNTFVIVLSMPPGGIAMLKSTTGKPEGPYVHAFSPEAPILRSIDPTLFQDDDGSVYFTSGGAQRIYKLKDDLSGFDGEPHVLKVEEDHNPETHGPRCPNNNFNDLGREGAVLFKANGKYYVGAADWPQGRYSTMLAMSDNIYGPYTGRHESVPCGGGTGFFKDKQGEWWSSFFGNDDQSPFREKPAIVKVKFASNGVVSVDHDHYRKAGG